MRIVKKVPDLVENFLDRAKHMLNERTHGPLLTGVTLLIEMCSLDPHIIEDLRAVCLSFIEIYSFFLSEKFIHSPCHYL